MKILLPSNIFRGDLCDSRGRPLLPDVRGKQLGSEYGEVPLPGVDPGRPHLPLLRAVPAPRHLLGLLRGYTQPSAQLLSPLHHPPPCAGVDGAGADPEQRRHGGRGAGPADQLHVRHPGGLHPAARLHRGLQRHQLRLRVRRQLRGAGGGEHGGRARLAGGLARGQHRGRLLHPERGPGAQGGARAPGGGGHTALNQIQMIIQQLYYRIDIFIDK